MQRYSVIEDKNQREIVLLRGKGCRYKQCTFCDYHFDASTDENANLEINREALSKVTGRYSVLEVINSGSFCELDESTMALVVETCSKHAIKTVHFECHWLYRNLVADLRKRFGEGVMKKGIRERNPGKISEGFDECCLLFGLPGQTVESMQNDIETGLKLFKRVCVNIMVENSAPLKPDESVRLAFVEEVMPRYIENPRVDILLNNTDFGVGSKE